MMGTMAMISSVEMTHNMNQWAMRVVFDKVYSEGIEEHWIITGQRWWGWPEYQQIMGTRRKRSHVQIEAVACGLASGALQKLES
jgi:hypothetical protein